MNVYTSDNAATSYSLAHIVDSVMIINEWYKGEIIGCGFFHTEWSIAHREAAPKYSNSQISMIQDLLLLN